MPSPSRLTSGLASAYHRPMASSGDRSEPLSLLRLPMALLAAARPKQWTKNLMVFFALLFSINEVRDPSQVDLALWVAGKAVLAFVLFSALSSAVYMVNDIFDVERDRLHPRKRLRPIASGRLPVAAAWTAAVALAAIALGLSFVVEPLLGLVALAYLVLMTAYSSLLKHIVLLDVFSISGGFVLRAVAGAAVIDVPISPWLYTCTGLGALLIALGKRRSELSAAQADAPRQRDALEWYTTSLLDQYIAIVAPATLVAYTLYTFTAPNLPDNHAMMLTVPFVVYGLFRYVYLVHAKGIGESPEDILVTDIPLIVSIAMWLITAIIILTAFR